MCSNAPYRGSRPAATIALSCSYVQGNEEMVSLRPTTAAEALVPASPNSHHLSGSGLSRTLKHDLQLLDKERPCLLLMNSIESQLRSLET